MNRSRVIYFDHETQTSHPPPPFASGEAGFVWVNDEGEFASDTQVQVPPNTVHALMGHGVLNELNRLELVLGPVSRGCDAVVAPASVEQAARIFYEADRMTYGAVHDLLVERIQEIEYRIVVNNREYQRTLSRLQFLSGTAARLGRGLRFRFG